ncbi:MAG: hypothetical protein QOD00_716, partial [Blastocatellia bacterium]|nr:hypothetical protein [Blastocatellia bacterium]
LLATQLISRVRELFHLEVGLRSLFERPTVRGLAQVVEERMRAEKSVIAPPIVGVRREGQEEIPLSFAQQRLWFLDQLEPNSSAYNIPTSVRLNGALDVAAIERALNEVVRRHEALRTTFQAVNRRPRQLIASAQTMSLPLIDLQQLEEDARAAETRRLMAEEARRPFDLRRGPLLRASLLRLNAEEHLVLLTMHHIVSDGWSMTVLMREVATLYEAFSKGERSPLVDLPVQYADFAIWQREWFSGEHLEQQLAYWRQHLSGKLPLLALPTDRPRSAALEHRGAQETLLLSPALRDSLKQLGQREGATLYMTMLAAFYILLSRVTGQDDITLGTDVANRNRSETEQLIGFFVNQLVLRAKLSGNPSFRDFLKQVRELTLMAYAHQDLPFDKLVETLNPDRAASRTPLFQAKIVFQNAPASPLELRGLVLTPLNVGGGTGQAKFDLLLNLVETDAGLQASLEYSADLFDAATMRRMLGNYETLLGGILAQPDAFISDLEILMESEKIELEAERRKREESKLKKFKSIKPKIISVPQDKLVRTGELRPGETLPLLVQPATDNLDLAEWVTNNLKVIEGHLLKHGGVLFRGFEIKSQAGFEKFLAATSVELMYYMEGATPRTKLSDKVYTSTEYPPDESIALHNELTYVVTWPMKIWFYCLQPAAQKGQTPIADVRRVFERIDPQIRERFSERGWMLVRNFGDGLSLNWQDSFHTDDKAEVEKYCRAARIECEWKPGDRLRTRQVRPAIAQHPQTHEMVWFNHVAFWHVSSLRQEVRDAMLTMLAEDELPYNTYYGDGSPIENNVIDSIREAYAAQTVEFDWQAGDVLMLDNMLVAHGRNPFTGPRKVLVAMGEAFTRTDI